MALASIGTNAAKCSPAVATPCVIAVADVATQGEALRLTAPMTPKSDAKPVVSSTTTSAATATTAGPEVQGTVQAASGTLPYTGSGPSTWVLLVMGLALFDLGWLAVTATRPPRRRA
jgi:hypothetical protein